MSQFEWGEDPEHQVLPDSRKYAIVGLRLLLEPDDAKEPYLDLELRADAQRRVLRFWSPSELEIERGGPTRTGGLVILDLSRRQLHNVNVRVTDDEASHGAVRFLARAVQVLR